MEEVYKILQREDHQIKKIIKITRYKFGWGRKTIFNFIMNHCQGLSDNVPESAKKVYSTSRLFASMSNQQKSQIIKILEQIEKRNKKNGN